MKVCHVTSAHKNDDTRIFHKECTSLANAGYDTYLVVCGDDLQKNGVHIVGTGAQSLSRIKRMTKDAKKAYKTALSLDADIYHFHDPELLPYAVKIKKKGKTVIFDSHENYPAQISVKAYLPRFARKIIAAIYKLYETSCTKKLDAIIFPCLIDGKHPFENRCKICTTVDNYPIIGNAETQDTVEENAVCYIGSLTYARGITSIVRAAHMAGVKLILAGNFSPASYKDEVFAMPESECVEYLGKVPHDKVQEVISRSKIGMCVLKNIGQYRNLNNFATKVFEYWMADKPVIVSDLPYNVKEMEKIQGGICVDPDDIEAIAKAIRSIIDDPTRASTMAERGKTAVLSHYNWAHEEQKLLALYKELEK